MTREEAANILDPEIDIQYLLDFIREHYGKRGVDSALLCECVDAEACRMGAEALRELNAQEKPKTPCDLCLYNPPSSGDGKPCTMCPASSLPEPLGDSVEAKHGCDFAKNMGFSSCDKCPIDCDIRQMPKEGK